jgi:hypothetical protein
VNLPQRLGLEGSLALDRFAVPPFVEPLVLLVSPKLQRLEALPEAGIFVLHTGSQLRERIWTKFSSITASCTKSRGAGAGGGCEIAGRGAERCHCCRRAFLRRRAGSALL